MNGNWTVLDADYHAVYLNLIVYPIVAKFCFTGYHRISGGVKFQAKIINISRMNNKNGNIEGLISQKISERIRELRKKSGLTQEKLAELAGIDYKFLQRIEGGDRNITLKTLVKICDSLDISMKDFFDFKE